jgi:alpha-galactosidase
MTMRLNVVLKLGAIWLASLPLLLSTRVEGGSASSDELLLRRDWTVARFEGRQPPPRTNPALVVLANHGPVQKNARGDKPLRIVERDYTRGLYCHAPSKISVRLPGPGERFAATVGVDSNDQTSGGRGSVDFSVHVRGAEKFRSGVMREGMAGKAVTVDLGGASEFILHVDETPDGIACDQADWADAKVTLKNGREVWLADLPLDESPGADAVSTALPFSFSYDGLASTDLLKGWNLSRSMRMMDSNRTERTLTFTDQKTGLAVRCVSVEYQDFPSVEWTLHFKNSGTNNTPILSDIQALDTQWSQRGQAECVLNHHSGDDCTPDSYEPHRLALAPKSEHRFAPAGGRPTNRGFPYFNIEWPGHGIIVAVGWPGQWAARFTRDAGGALRVRAGQELTHFSLRPGEEVRSPLIVLQFWKGARVEAQNVWRRWMLAHNLPRTRDGKLPLPILSSGSGGFFPGLKCDEAGEFRFLDAFAQAGIKLDYWWMDAGWYPCGDGWPNVGTWTPDKARFPRGLKAVSDRAHANGAGLIVWFEPERVSPGTWLATNHPDWILGGAKGGLLNLGHSAARQWLTEHVDQLLTAQGIDFYRQDFNIDPLPYWRAHDSAERQGITEIRHVEGYLAYWDELQRRHPGLLIDSCASGGRRNDLETLRRAVPLLRSDYQSFSGDPAYAAGNQGHTYGLSSWIPYYGQGVYYSDRQFVYAARSHFCPAFGLAVDVRQPGVDWAILRRLTEQWRRVAPCFLGDFYPLTPYRLDADVWIAWQFDLPDTGEGMVQAFRREGSAYEAARFKLRGLDAGARYLVTDLDGDAPVQMTGRELLEQGLPVTLKGRPTAGLIGYRRIR